MPSQKRKADCTPEEWAAIRAQGRKNDAKQRAKPERQEYMRRYQAKYTQTEEYREKDNARYGAARREKQLASFRARTYGMSVDEIARLREAQGNACALCGAIFAPLEKGKKHTTECVDHCHDSQRVRGLLCRMCNTFEGFLRKKGISPQEYANRMTRYLECPPAMVLTGEDLV